MADKATRHNTIVSETLRRVMEPLNYDGGRTSEVMVILESLVAGALTSCAIHDRNNSQQRDDMLMALENNIRERLQHLPIQGRSG